MEYSKDQLKYSIHKNKECTFVWTWIHPTWTPIEPISKDIQISLNSFHIITRIQFPTQLAASCIIHQTQGLTLDYLTFDPTNIYKHGLTYTIISCVQKKEIFKLLQHLQMNFFQIDPSVAMEMH
jgi:hypothetical protein